MTDQITKRFPAALEAEWVRHDIKTVPACLRRFGTVHFKNGARLIRGGNGVYLAHLDPGPPPSVRGFQTEEEMIDFINQNKPWRPSDA